MASGYVPWEIRDFSEGMVDRVDDTKLPENAAKDCRNWISRYIGRMEKRRGQKRLNSGSPLPGSVMGIHAYYEDQNRHLVVASGGGIYVWNHDSKTFNAIKTGWVASQPVCFETCANYMVAFNGVNTPVKWDGITASDLLNAPIKGQFPTLYKEKLFVVPKDHPSELWWSESFQPEEWPPDYYWRVKDGDGDVITCLRHLYDDLIVFKGRSIHIFRGNGIDDFSLYELEPNIGCAGPRAATAYLNKMYFVSEEGLFEFNGVKAVNISDERIPRLWTKINTQALKNAAAAAWDGWIWFALPYGESTVNNLVILFNPITRSFWPMDGINASCFQIFNDGTTLNLYSGDTSAGYVIQQDVGTEDFEGDTDETPVSAYWEGRGYDQGYPEHEKTAKRVYVEDAPDTESPAVVELSANYGEFSPLAYRRSNGLIRVYKVPKELRKWNYITPKISHSEAGPCEIRGLMVRHKIKGKPKIREVKR
jgi:hypothetical protein